jgi:hypothetical protein
MGPDQTSRENAMKIIGNLANHSRVIARPGVIARSKLSANHSRVIARLSVITRSKLASNHSRAIA